MVKLWLAPCFVIAFGLIRYVYSSNNRLPDCSVRPSVNKQGEERATSGTDQRKARDANRHLLLVSTLDGHVSALDPENEGRLLWSHNTGEGSMLSSSISQLEMTSNGRPVRLIPSLDGNLYKFNGDTLEPMPITADSLLKSSFKLGDDVIITGGIDSSSYGISLDNGQLRYLCSMNGCKTNGEQVKDEEDILVVRRLSQTVRAVAPRSGDERWNFSVGEHRVTFLEKLEADCSGGRSSHSNLWEERINSPSEEYDIRVIVPEGLVIMSSKTGALLWRHKFDNPIVHAWLLKNGKLNSIDLFDRKQIVPLPQKGEMKMAPLLYVGHHQRQLYIQNSAAMRQRLIDYNSLPLIEWKPYAISSFSRTPYINHGKTKPDLLTPNDELGSTALVVKHSDLLEYPFDSGYYIYSSTSLVENKDNLTTCPEDDNQAYDNISIISNSIWNWWKEVLGISLLSSFLVHIIFTRREVRKMKRKLLAESSSAEIHIVATPTTPIAPPTPTENIPNKMADICEYKSRYTTDFEPIQRLGKGGFGVVYEARNKIDDCHYAVKRILLPPRVDAQEKVMREVRALAKLDHAGIVRYFNAWQESPPQGWQEQHDSQWEECSQMNTGTNLSSSSNSFVSKATVYTRNKQAKKTVKSNPFKMAADSCSLSTINRDNESGSFSFENGDNTNRCSGAGDCKSNNNNNDSFEIVFQSGSDRVAILSSGVGLKPPTLELASRFEDSGCADRSQSTDTEDVSCEAKAVRPIQLDIEAKISKTDRLYLYIQMQLCRKETLKDWLSVHTERERDEVLDIFEQIVSAVHYVHECNLMHRDLKPSNIFFSVDGTVKVGDFGLVTALTENETHTPNSTQTSLNYMNRHTDQVGTQLYMSPEQFGGHSYSHKVDIYSLGLIFYEMLNPFSTQMERGTVMQKIKSHVFPDRFTKSYPEECALIKSMLSLDPLQRPSAIEIKQHSLFKAYQPHPEISLRYRRRRTLSQRISSSGSECEPDSSHRNNQHLFLPS